MIVAVSKKFLLEELELAAKWLGRETTKIELRADGSGLSLRGSAVKRSAHLPLLPSRVLRTGTLTIDIDELRRGVKAMPQGEFTLVVETSDDPRKRSHTVRLKTSERSVVLSGRLGGDPVAELSLPSAVYAHLPLDVLREIAVRVVTAVSFEESRFQLQSAHFEHRRDQKLTTLDVCATDGHRLAHCRLAIPRESDRAAAWLPGEGEANVHGRILREIAGFEGLSGIETELRWSPDEEIVGLVVDGRRFAHRSDDRTFPDWRRLVTHDYPLALSVDRAALVDSMKAAALEVMAHVVSFTFTPNQPTVTISGWRRRGDPVYEDAIEFLSEPEEAVAFNINPRYVLEAAESFAPATTVLLELRPSKLGPEPEKVLDAIVFRPTGAVPQPYDLQPLQLIMTWR